MKIRGQKMIDKVLMTEGNGGILILPYDEGKASLPEYLEGHFGSYDRLVLPQRLTLKYGIEKAVSLEVNLDDSILVKPITAVCMVCGCREDLVAVGYKTNTYICKRCCKQ